MVLVPKLIRRRTIVALNRIHFFRALNRINPAFIERVQLSNKVLNVRPIEKAYMTAHISPLFQGWCQRSSFLFKTFRHIQKDLNTKRKEAFKQNVHR